MGVAALVVGIFIVATLGVAILYGTIVGMGRFGRLLWRVLVAVPNSEVQEAVAGVSCWEDNECPPSVRDACPAFMQRDERLPCWLTNLRAEGHLRVACLTCDRFKVADLVTA